MVKIAYMVIDSSVWLEIFLDGSLTDKCGAYLNNKNLMVSASVIFEVCRKVKSKMFLKKFP